MNNYPKCSKCGEELEPWRWDDFWAEDSYVAAIVRGFCPKCHKPFSWTEIYKYADFSDLEADDED